MAIDKHGYGGYGVYAAAGDADVDSDTPEEYEEYDCPSNMVVGNVSTNAKNQMTFQLNCRDGDLAGVRRCLDEDGTLNVNSRDSVSMTPLMWAAHEGHIEIARLLLEVRADPWAVDVMRPDRAVRALDYAMGCGLPVVEGDSEDEEGLGPLEPNERMVALIRSFMPHPLN